MMKTNRTFHALLAIQFLLIVCRIFMDVKVGLFSLVFTGLFTIIILIQLNSDEHTDWTPSRNAMLYLLIPWFIFYLLEVFNPNNSMEAWNINIVPYALIPILCAFIIPIVIRNTKDIEWLLYIWAAFIVIASLKGYWQKNQGFTDRERYFLFVLGGARTHIIWSGIRFFSLFSDAAIYGIHSAMAAITFGISTFYVHGMWKKLFFLSVVFAALYGMGISGTRSAMAIIVVGLLMWVLLSKSWKMGGFSITTLATVFCFFYFTNIGDSNPFIYKMRSAFRPTKDASYMVRVENRKRMAELMIEKPMGYGIGLSKTGNFESKEFMPYPPDSWLVSVWVETGIIGLMLYLVIHGLLFVWCSWILLFKVRNKRLRGLVVAWLCMDAGFFVSAYVNDVLQYPNQMPVYIGFALCFAARHIDQKLEPEVKKQKTNDSTYYL